jgi:hypothetical protein
MSQVVEHLPCKHEALSSNPSTAEKKKERKNAYLTYMGNTQEKNNSELVRI